MDFGRRARCFAGCMFLLLAVLRADLGALGGEAEDSHRQRLANRGGALLREEQEADARVRANPKDSQALRARGLARLNLGNLSAASADLSRAAALRPSQAEIQSELSFALLLQGRWAEALDAARTALALDPQNAAAHAYAGHVLLRVGGALPEAIVHLERASQSLSRNVDVHFDLLEAFRQSGDAAKALSQLRKLRYLLDPTDPRVIYQEGVLQADLGNLQMAINRFRATLASDPRQAGARGDLGAVLIEAEKPQEALAVLEPLAKDQPRSFAAAYFRSLALARLQRWAEAEAEARRALSLDRNSADAGLLLGRILAAQGLAEPAIAQLRRTLLLDAGNLEVTLQLGETLVAAGKLEEGLAVLREAVRQAPQDPAAHLRLASALRLAGRGVEAAQASAAASRLNQEAATSAPDQTTPPPSPKP